jgi:uncharacterized protein with FMN-binding domain
MKKEQLLRVLMLALISIVILSCAPLIQEKKVDETKKLIGTGRGYSSQIKVEVTMHGDTIVSIDLLESGDTPGLFDAAFDGVVHTVLKRQSTKDVDAVTGATGSSNGVVEAINNALEGAE